MGRESAPAPAGDSDVPVPVRDKIPLRLWLAMAAGMMERAVYYGSMIMIQNYVQNPPFVKSRPGILGLGQAKATQVQFGFTLANSVTPFVGALLADSTWGRHRTILYSFPIYFVGLALLCGVSFHSEIAQKAGLGTLLVCLLFIAIGSGGIRTNMNAFIGDQYILSSTEPFRDKRGRLVKPDQALTLQYIYSAYYWMINVGSLAGIITTLLEKDVGFGVAFLVPVVLISLAMLIFVASSKTFVKHGPSKGNLARTMAYVGMYLRSRFRRSEAGNPDESSQKPSFNEKFIKDMSDTWKACRIFATFTIPWLCWDQATNNFISQAGDMITTGVPNDMLWFLNPIVLVAFIPLFEEMVFPFLRARGFKLPQLTRIFVGFVILTVSMAYVSGLQALIYSRGPCYDHPRACPGSPNGSVPNNISAFAQVPVYVLQSIAEIFSQITVTEYAYSQAPAEMRSMMQAIGQSFGALAAALGVAIGPVSKDPWLVTLYACMAGVMALTSVIFWWFFLQREEKDGEASTSLVSGPASASAAETRELES